MNYTKVEERYIDTIKSTVAIYSHNKTKAKVACIKNDDENKVFSISFRTPPMDDTGLTHILEHSVLCGSKKYPVKDPFVELIKSSLNTFLNAYTFPDKTMYPIASLDLADFKNLMDVYLDAVFYPQIYNHKEIFMQEGWHYELDASDNISYNGVVYNEMKGAFSDPNQVLYRDIMHSLYPDTQYSFESGGDPKYIPNLSYEKFLDFHFKYYHPSNSYIMIYGDLDMEERLEYLDNNYLSKFNYSDFDTKLLFQKPFNEPIEQIQYYQIGKDEKLENNTYLSYNVALPRLSSDVKDMIAADLLINCLFQAPGAKIKQALIDKNLGDDVDTLLECEINQPFLTINIVNSNLDKKEEFIDTINQELYKAINGNLDKDLLLSLINFSEFKTRERMFSSSSPQGLNIQMAMLSTWLYNDNMPYEGIDILKYYDELKEAINTDYYENIIEEYILNNNHKTYVHLVPSYDCNIKYEKELSDKLAEFKNSLSKEELDNLKAQEKALKIYQSEPSRDEDIATLPKLKISDINPLPQKGNLEVIKNDNYDILFNNYDINGINYVRYYYDISNLNYDDLIILSLYVDCFKEFDTLNYTYQQINQEIKNISGGISLSLVNTITKSKEDKIYLIFSFSAINSNLQKTNDLLLELINNVKFNDYKRLSERLFELKARIDNSLARRGHTISLVRALSYISKHYKLKDLTSGIDYYDYISDLVNNLDSKKDYIISSLTNILKKIINKNNLYVGFTGTKEELDSSSSLFNKMYNNFDTIDYVYLDEFKENILNEAFVAQTNVNYCARVGAFNCEFNGSLYVLNNCLSMGYLWEKIRVLGGAYGAMMNINESGYIGFTTYRDPNIDSTYEVYEKIIDYIKNLDLTEEELTNYKIGAIGNAQVVQHDSSKADSERMNYLRGYTYEDRCNNRKAVLEATLDDLRSAAKIFEEALSKNVICVVGSSISIEDSNIKFDNIKNLKK